MRQIQLRDTTFNLLAVPKNWMIFSNHTNLGQGLSIESLHDLVHNLVGGQGNMGSVEMAGFDPIFFLHHTNVSELPYIRTMSPEYADNKLQGRPSSFPLASSLS